MTKTNITISVEAESFEKFRKIVGRGFVSARITDYINNTINSEAGNVAGVDIVLLKKQIEEKVKNQTDNAIKLNELRDNLDLIEHKLNEEETMKLQQEKEKLETAARCINCHNLLGDKKNTHPFPLGLVCNACYSTCHNPDVKKWSEKNE